MATQSSPLETETSAELSRNGEYINTAEVCQRFPQFTTKLIHYWWKFGHPAIDGRLNRIPIPGRKRYYLYDAQQLERIDAYWDQAEQSDSPAEMRDKDGTTCLRADLVFAEYGLCLHDLYDWHRTHCAWLDASQNPARLRGTHYRLRSVRRSHFGKGNKRRYEILYFRRDQLEEIKRNQSAWKAYEEEGWLFQNGIGSDQGIPPGVFRSWCLKGFPRDAPKLEIRRLLCPVPDGRNGWRVMYTPDSIKRLAALYNGLRSADEAYRGEGGIVYRNASYLLEMFSRRTGKPPRAPKLGRPARRSYQQRAIAAPARDRMR